MVLAQNVGRVKSEQGTISGQTASFVTPSGKLWRVVCFRGLFTTDATAANRILGVRLLDADGNILYIREASALVPASSTVAVVGETATLDVTETNPIYLQIPQEHYISEGMKVEVSILNGAQAGDAFSEFYALVREFDI